MSTTPTQTKLPIPNNWLLEIEAGTEFGKRAVKAIEAIQQRTNQTFNAPNAPASYVGTQIRKAFQNYSGHQINCGACLFFLRNLNYSSSHDHDEIARYMARHFDWPVDNTESFYFEVASDLIHPIVPRHSH
jgi:hypothetical protein